LFLCIIFCRFTCSGVCVFVWVLDVRVGFERMYVIVWSYESVWRDGEVLVVLQVQVVRFSGLFLGCSCAILDPFLCVVQVIFIGLILG